MAYFYIFGIYTGIMMFLHCPFIWITLHPEDFAPQWGFHSVLQTARVRTDH